MRDSLWLRGTMIESFEPLILLSASGAGDDVLNDLYEGHLLDGTAGDDTLIALVGDSVLNGGAGNDTLISVRGDNILDGGDGLDTVQYWADRAAVTFVLNVDGSVLATVGDRTDRLVGVELLQFDDGAFSLAEILDDTEYRSIDGTGNNLSAPELGSTNQHLLRMTPAEYGDGIAEPAGADRPSARVVSNEIAAQATTSANDRGMTDMSWLWGQFVDHDITLSEGAEPHEEFNIDVAASDELFDPDNTGDVQIPLGRTVYDHSTGDSDDNPRQQLNQITAFVDGSGVYGSDEVRAAELRSFVGGQLRVGDNDLLILNDAGLPNAGGPGGQLFLAGDIRANENAALTSMHTVWVREHNRIAEELATQDPTLTDEQLYQQARNIVAGEIQVITYNEFLPALLGDTAIPEYTGYNPAIDPSIATEFSTAAYRFGHSMLSSELLRLDNDGGVSDAGNLSLRNAFFAPHEVLNNGIDSVLLGVTRHAANEIDTMVVDDIRNFLFGQPGQGGFDLASLNIQRGRDHGLADYNQVRAELGLGAVSDFDEITSDVELQNGLRDVYSTVDNIDLWVGGLAEDHVNGSSLGETFQTILVDQFTRLRDGDRFWYQNIFEGELLQEVEATTLADVLERNTDIQGLQDNVFFLSGV